MKIIIEIDGSGDKQPEIKKITGATSDQHDTSLSVSTSDAAAVDGGHAPTQSSTVTSATVQNTQNSFSSAAGADAGAAKIQEETMRTTMTETGSAVLFDKNNAYPAGSYSGSMNN